MDETTRSFYQNARFVAQQSSTERVVNQTTDNSQQKTARAVAHTQHPTEKMRQEAGNHAATAKINQNFEAAKSIPKDKKFRDLTPDQQYQKLFAEKNKSYESNPNRQKTLVSQPNHSRLEATDQDIAKNMIKHGGCKDIQVAETLNKHSPKAAHLEAVKGREAKQMYCANVAVNSDRKVQDQHERQERSKYQTQDTHASHEQQILAAYHKQSHSM